MGIDVESKLIVGLSFPDLETWLEEQRQDDPDLDIISVIEENFIHASPSYDCDLYEWIIGYEVGTYKSAEEVVEEIKELEIKFQQLTNLQPMVYDTPHVY